MASTNTDDEVQLRIDGRVASIVLNAPRRLNACSNANYQRIALLLREIEEMKHISITILAGTGRYFSAGANVKSAGDRHEVSNGDTPRIQFLKSFGATNLELTRALYEHPKILVAALNGPAVGLSAAMVAHADFVYAVPSTFLLTPFTSIGLVAEGGASYMFAKRMGLGLANEALIGSKRITSERLLAAGFINKMFDQTDDVTFNKQVVEFVKEEYGDHLNQESILLVKSLVKKAFLGGLEEANLAEIVGGVERFRKGVPQQEFAKLASGAKKHKL